MTPKDGLVVVVPHGMRVDAAAIVASKRGWAVRALADCAEKRAQHQGGPDAMLPAVVELRVVGHAFRVQTETVPGSSRMRVIEREDSLVVSGPDDPDARVVAMNAWLDRRARAWLPARLEELAAAHGLTYQRVRITRARSRWGSCSSRGTISLNRALMFFPRELADALILHELAHTRAMDHSARFWTFLGTLDPNTARNRRALKSAASFVPAWAEL